MSDQLLSETLGAIYEAGLAPPRWYDAVAKVVEFVGGESGMVGLTDPATGRADASYLYRLDPELMRRWGEEFDFEDPWADAMVGLPEGEIGRGSDLMAYEDVRTRAVYREIVEPVGAHDTCWTVIAKNQLRVGWLSAFQGRAKGAFSRESVERMALLAPHLVRAARIHARLADLELRERASRDALDSLSFALITCRSDGQLVSANRRGENLFRAERVLKLVGGRLACEAPEQTSRLLGLISAAAATADPAEAARGGTMVMPSRDPEGPPLTAIVSPISQRLEPKYLPHEDSGAEVLLIVQDPERSLAVPEGILGELYGLTPSETRVAMALARGEPLHRYADSAGIAVETARWYVKQVQAKTDTRSQAALVSLLLRVADPRSPEN